MINYTEVHHKEVMGYKLIGILINNWSQRTILIYEDPLDPIDEAGLAEHVYAVGFHSDRKTILVTREKLAECRNFAIAIDYWKHGGKVYVRD